MNTIISRYANVTNIKYIVEFREINGACLARLIQHSNDFAFPYVLPYIVAFVRWASFSLFISPFVSICLPFLLFSLSPSLFLSPFPFLSLPFYSFLLLPPSLSISLSRAHKDEIINQLMIMNGLIIMALTEMRLAEIVIEEIEETKTNI